MGHLGVDSSFQAIRFCGVVLGLEGMYLVWWFMCSKVFPLPTDTKILLPLLSILVFNVLSEPISLELECQ